MKYWSQCKLNSLIIIFKEKEKMYSEIIKNWSIAQKAGALLPCPRCGCHKMKSSLSSNAFSRRADIYICDSCGTQEAIEDMRAQKILPNLTVGSKEYNEEHLKYWWLITNVLGEIKYRPFENDYEIEYEIALTRKCYLSKENIDDIMCTALEGGITYWANFAEPIEDEVLGEYLHEQLTRGGSIRIHDSEDGETYMLTLDKLINGFALACKNGYGSDWFDNDNCVDCCMIDAIGADIIVQYAIFGDVIYG